MATSLRLRIVVAVLVVALGPLALVFAWSQVDRNVAGDKWNGVRVATEEAAALIDGQLNGDELAARVASIAEAHHVRLRVFAAEDSPRADADSDAPVDAMHRVERFFFGNVPTETVREIDDTFGPIERRPEVMFAARGEPFVGCEYRAMLFCQAVRVVTTKAGERFVLIAQASSHRAVQPVYLLRRQLLRIGVLTLPVAILLAWYASHIIVRPLEKLRGQALAQAERATRGAALLHAHRDEVGDLTAAFNTLLATLDEKREQNERFVADLAHDLKNPVAAIRACAEQLADGAGKDAASSKERSERLARVLNDSAQKLDRVVTHFLELARAEAGLPDEERTAVDIGALAEGITSVLESDSRWEGLTLSCSVPPASETARVLGVEHRLESLLRELLENAVSFAGSGGRVSIAVTRERAHVHVVVEDSGPGIAREDLPRVFERFFTTRGRTRGTGLGLALVKAVAEAHGGAVTVRSAPGEGATFTVVLPSV